MIDAAKTRHLNTLYAIRARLGDPDDPESLPLLWTEMLCFLSSDQLGEYLERLQRMMPELRIDGDDE